MCEQEDASRHTEADGGTAARTLTLHAPQDATTGGIGSAPGAPGARIRQRDRQEAAGEGSGLAVGRAVSGRCLTESVQR